MIAININAVGFKADVKLEEFIEKKVSKLINLYDRVLSAEVILRLDAKEKMENKISELRLLVPGDDFFAKKQCDTFEEAVDDCIEAIKKQIVKHKEKIVEK
jgi:putative sigma-54 modulation protein